MRTLFALALALAAPQASRGGNSSAARMLSEWAAPFCPDPLPHINEKCTARQDYIVVADNSDSIGDSYYKMTTFMTELVDLLDLSPGSDTRMALITFNGPPIGQGHNWLYDEDDAVQILSGFTTDRDALINAIAHRPDHEGMTCISCGIDVAARMIQESDRLGINQPVVILVTDGEQTVGGTSQRAVDAANSLKAAFDVQVIGVMAADGHAGNRPAMQQMVTAPSSIYLLVRTCAPRSRAPRPPPRRPSSPPAPLASRRTTSTSTSC